MRARERSNKFGRHDRIRIDGESFRVVNKDCGNFLLQSMTEDILEDRFVVKSDAEINRLIRNGQFACDEGYFSKTLGFLRQRVDTSDLSDLPEEDLRTIAWKTEWCVRFNRRRIDLSAPWRPAKTPPQMERFIESERAAMDLWYFELYGERRPPGRKIPGERRKEFDYPAPSTLRSWLNLFRKSGERMEAFRMNYSACGNRNQIPMAAERIITQRIERYKHNTRPAMSDIYQDVEYDVMIYNSSRPKHEHIKVSDTTVRRRIKKIDPFLLDAGREGIKRAIRKYTPVGLGLAVHTPMQRVEMDDWTMDLAVLGMEPSKWLKLTDAQKERLGTIRCTITIAIDVATRCIVGFHMTRNAPSNLTAKAALRSILMPKTALTDIARCKSEWPMYGRVESLATDGGPAFNGADIEETLKQAGIARLMPNQDPRMRGTIEAFFRTFKAVCRYYAGQTFANPVERGEYPSEEMASATFETALISSIRWIVDIYHHRGHRGLEGRTPASEWNRLTNEPFPGLKGPMDPHRIATIFGYKESRVIDKHGITSLALSYNDPVRLPLLRSLVGNKAVDFYVDPHDLGTIYVLVPKEHREHSQLKPLMEGDFLVIDSVDHIGSGVSLEDHIKLRKETIAYGKKQEEDGKSFRLQAHKDLLEDAESVRRAAGVDTFALSQKQFQELSSALRRASNAAFNKDYRPKKDEGTPSKTPPKPLVDLTKQDLSGAPTPPSPTPSTGKTSPPRRRSTNTYRDDD